MIKVTVQKNLIGLEDLLIGLGTVEQDRGPSSASPVTITRINGANLPYDADFSMQEKFDALQTQIDTLPEVVDGDGNMLTGLINSSASDLDLANRLWRKTISSSLAEIYYYNQLLFQYNPTAGNLIIPEDSDYIAADALVTAAFEAADEVLQDQIDALGTAAYLDVGTTANKVVQLTAAAKLPAIDGSLLTNLPSSSTGNIGAIEFVPYSTPDTNFMKCDGTAISRSTYATLFAKIGTNYGIGDGSTTFNLPELRGEFIRVWDDSRGIDIGRTIGSTQAASFASHDHGAGSLAASSGGAHTHTVPVGTNDSGSGGARTGPVTAGSLTTSSNGAHTHTISGSTSSSGSTETKPRNIALMAQIRVL